MEIIITESQLNILIIEASKVDILIDKLGFEPKGAQYLEVLSGNLSVWLGKKLAEYLGDGAKLDYSEIKDNEDKIGIIMKWVKVGLSGNFKQYQESSFVDILEMANKWYESKNTIDKEKVIIDFRDSNGMGYYWVSLGRTKCAQEGKRMRHCGEGKSGLLYSLRRTFPTKDAYKSNEPVVTAAITTKGKLVEIKGPSNTDPKSEYYPYIAELFLHKNDDGRYFISELGPRIYVIIKISPNIKKLSEIRPDLFNSVQATLFQKSIVPGKYYDDEGFPISSGLFEPVYRSLKTYDDYDEFENEHPGVALNLLGINARDLFERTGVEIISLNVVMKNN
jgi:hypothetical protein